MTRVTKLYRKTHLESSGFNVTPLVPKKNTSNAAEPETGRNTQGSNGDQEDVGLKRKREESQDTSTQVTAAEATTTTAGDDAPGKKAKRQRHRSKNKVEGQEVDSSSTKNIAGSANEAKSELNGSKKEKEILKRRTRRERMKERKMICFLCRQTGHSIKFCPKAGASVETKPNSEGTVELVDSSEPVAEGICYKCGSTEHKSSQCKKRVDPDNPYPFAHCFVCKKQGHLAGLCPQNERGLYPNGGGCRFCGSVRHLAKDCKPASGQEVGVNVLGTIDLDQGGDDDDVFLALQKIQYTKGSKKGKLSSGTVEPTGQLSPSNSGVVPAKTTVKPKKVVKF